MSETTEKGLTGTQKVAVVLMNMDSQRAAGVLKDFTEQEADQNVAEIVRLRRVDSVVA
jgi:flagellar motor switch protein FliG